MAKWVWNIDEKICINVSAISYFGIDDSVEGIFLYAIFNNEKVRIAKAPGVGILKDKIRSIISGEQ